VTVKVCVCVCEFKNAKRLCSKCSQCARMQARRRGRPPLHDCFVNELLIFANLPLPPAAMLPFDGAVCVNILQQFVQVLVEKFRLSFLLSGHFN